MARKMVAGVVAVAGFAGVAGCGSTDPQVATVSPNAEMVFGSVVDRSVPLTITAAVGMQAQMGAMSIGIDPDLEHPAFISQVDSDGDQREVAFQPEVGETVDELSYGDQPTVEIWRNHDTEVWDVSEEVGSSMYDTGPTTGSEVSAAMAEFFLPGQFEVDLAQVPTRGNPLAAQARGADPMEMFAGLAEQYDTAEPVEGADNTREFDTRLGELGEIPNSVVESLFVQTPEGPDRDLAQDAVTAFLDAPAQVTLTLDDQSRVVRAEISADLGETMRQIRQQVIDQGFEDAPGDPDAQEMIDGLGSLEVVVSEVLVVDYTAPADIVVPTDVTEDRTEQYVALVDALDQSTVRTPDTTVGGSA